MSISNVTGPYPLFTDREGEPLEAGYIWIGQPFLDPRTYPRDVYWDGAMSIPAAQPIRTINGYPSSNGTPGRLYADGDYSTLVFDKRGMQVFYAGSRLLDAPLNAEAPWYAFGNGVDATFDLPPGWAAFNNLTALRFYWDGGRVYPDKIDVAAGKVTFTTTPPKGCRLYAEQATVGPQGPPGVISAPGATIPGALPVWNSTDGSSLGAGYLPDDMLITAMDTTTARPLDERFADRLNVKDFGAIGDGVADDTASIQQAMDQGAALGRDTYFPAGEYLTTTDLIVSSGQRLVGDGAENTMLTWPQANGSATRNMFRSAGDLDDWSISGLHLRGNRAFQTTPSPDGQGLAALHLRGGSTTNISVDGCRVSQFGDTGNVGGAGILLGANTGTGKVISSIRIADTGFEDIANVPGVYISASTPGVHASMSDIEVSGCRFRNSVAADQNFIYVLGHSALIGTSVNISGNTLNAASIIDACIELNWIDNFQVGSNAISLTDGGTADGILLRSGCSNGEVIGNSIMEVDGDSTGRSAIALVRFGAGEYLDSIKISDNAISNWKTRGILVGAGSRQIDVSLNKVYGRSAADLLLDAMPVAGATDIRFLGNDVAFSQYVSTLAVATGEPTARVQYASNRASYCGDGVGGLIATANTGENITGISITNNEVLAPVSGTVALASLSTAANTGNQAITNIVSSPMVQVNPSFLASMQLIVTLPTSSGTLLTTGIQELTLAGGTLADPSLELGTSVRGLYEVPPAGGTLYGGIGVSVDAGTGVKRGLEITGGGSTTLLVSPSAAQNATAAGYSINLRGGPGGSTSGSGGPAVLTGGTPVDGNGASATLTGSNGVGTNRTGGAASMRSGNGTGSGNAGTVEIRTGTNGTADLTAINYTAGPVLLGTGGIVNWGVLGTGSTSPHAFAPTGDNIYDIGLVGQAARRIYATTDFVGPIGATTPNAGAFTTLVTSGNATLGDTSADAHILNGTLTAQTGARVLLDDSVTSAAAPPLTFDGDLDTGIYRPAPNSLAFGVGGNLAASFEPGGRFIKGGLVSLSALSNAAIQVPGTTFQDTGIAQGIWAASALGAQCSFFKSRGATVGSAGAVASGDGIMSLNAAADDGTGAAFTAARITANVNATPSAGIVPGRLGFFTADTGGVLTEILRIVNALWIRPGSAIPAGGSLDFAVTFGSSSGIGLYIGSGAPTVAAGNGSFYLRIDAGLGTHIYFRSGGAWGAVV